jgi:hypothetical protein
MIVSRLEQFREIDESALQHSDNFIMRSPPVAFGVAGLGYDWGRCEVHLSTHATRRAMDPFDKKPIFPIEIMVTVAINVVVVLLGYYVMIFLGVVRG